MSSETENELSVQSLPPCRVLVRSKNALEMYALNSCDQDASSCQPKVTLCTKPCTSTIPLCTALDGSFTLMHICNVGIVKCNLMTNGEILENFFVQSTVNVQMMSLSPLGNYLLTWEKLYVDTCPKNLKLWCMNTGKLLTSFAQKSLSRESWPYIQFTYNELYAFLSVNQTQIRIYNMQQDILLPTTTTPKGIDTTEPRYCSKLQIPCTTLSVQYHVSMTSSIRTPCQSSVPTIPTKYYFTTFVGKTKDKPAMASIYSYTPSNTDSSSSEGKTEVEFTRIACKSLFQAEECNTKWSPSIHQPPACLLTLSVAIDATGQSYYGNSQLYLWNHSNATTKIGNEMIAVPLPQDGPVLSCQWIPDPNKPLSFLVIAGKIPPMTSQHHGITGDVVFLYGNNVSRNTLICSPHGRFLCTAGFGNMPGGMSFWDVNKKKLLPHSIANASQKLKSDTPVTVHSWAPNSRYFIAATTAPRMNVDNGIQLYKYTGELISATTSTTVTPWNNKEYQPNHLYEAIFVPSLLHEYPDRPQSPIPEGHNTTTTTCDIVPTAVTTAPAKSTAYVPPSARRAANGTGTSLAERLRREKEGTVQGATSVVNNSIVAKNRNTNAPGNRVIPGLTQPTNTKTKSQVKREKLKQKLEQQPTTTTTAPSGVQPSATTVQQVPSGKAVTATTEVAVKVPPTAAAYSSVDVDKRVRKLKKILKQIEDLKLLPKLDADQTAKIASESAILSELKDLGV